MAKRLVTDMSADWQPEDYIDTFQEKIKELVETKAREGKIEDVEGDGGEQERKSADVIDLTELLKRSLAGKSSAKKTSAASKTKAKKAPVKPAATPRKTRKAS
jgi:DNA end-binding protein Ku